MYVKTTLEIEYKKVLRNEFLMKLFFFGRYYSHLAKNNLGKFKRKNEVVLCEKSWKHIKSKIGGIFPPHLGLSILSWCMTKGNPYHINWLAGFHTHLYAMGHRYLGHLEGVGNPILMGITKHGPGLLTTYYSKYWVKPCK